MLSTECAYNSLAELSLSHRNSFSASNNNCRNSRKGSGRFLLPRSIVLLLSSIMEISLKKKSNHLRYYIRHWHRIDGVSVGRIYLLVLHNRLGNSHFLSVE